MDNGYVKLYRSLNSWEWKNNPNMVALFIHFLLNANYQESKWRNLVIKEGQFVSSVSKLAIATGLTQRQIRTCLRNLQTTGELTIKTTNKYSLFTLNHWELYQGSSAIRDNQNVTLDAVTMTTNKEVKKKRSNKENNNYVIIKEKDNFELPDGISKDDWLAFQEMRKKIKKPMTLRAKKMLIDKLLAINQEYGDNPSEVLQQSILHSYQSVYPLKKENNYERKQRNYTRKLSDSEIIEQGLRKINTTSRFNVF